MAIRAESLQAMEFVEHNLVTDDAFLETQLLICRNVLIYFGAALQARALDLFERSLQRGGFLVLGSAESILGRDDTWAPRWQRQRSPTRSRMPSWPTSATNCGRRSTLSSGSRHWRCRAAPTPRQRQYLEKVGDAGQTLLAIINDLLDLTRIASGEMRFEAQPFSLRQTAARVLSVIGHRAAEKGCGSKRKSTSGFPRGSSAIRCASNRSSSTCSTIRSSSPRPAGRLAHHRRGPRRSARQPAARGRGFGNRHERKRDRPYLPAFRPGRPVDHPQARRHRPGPGDLQATRRRHAGFDRGQQPAGRRHTLSRPPAPGSGDRQGECPTGDEARTLPRICRRITPQRACWWSTISRSTARSSSNCWEASASSRVSPRTASRRWTSSARPAHRLSTWY
jgi:hypothetical protein